MSAGEERLLRVYAALGYRRACDRLAEWGAAHRGEIRLVPAEILAAALADWLRRQEGLDERGADEGGAHGETD